jgi:signal peptidase I
LRQKKKKPESRLSWLLYALLIALILLYAIFQNVVVGFAALLLIIIILIFEVRTSVATEGARKSFIDIAAAVGAAIVFWIALTVVLHTSAPIDAVSSCSMLPVLHRGDLVVLRGLDNISSFISSTHVPVANVSASAFARMQGNMSGEFLAYFAYLNGNKSDISFNFTSGEKYGIGLYSVACISRDTYYGKTGEIANCTVPQQAQQNNLIRYAYSIGNQSVGGLALREVYTSQITVGNTTLSENYSNPIIVYQTTSKDSFTGSVIHRLYAVLNVSGHYYFLTKGDNNPALDIEFGNYPANESAVLGYVIADIPVVGYVKLLLSGQIGTPQGCGSVLSAR